MFKVIASEGSTKVGAKGYHKQSLWIQLYGPDQKLEPYPTKFEKIHGPDDKPFAPGEYLLHPCSFGAAIDEKGNKLLKLNRMTLVAPAEYPKK